MADRALKITKAYARAYDKEMAVFLPPGSALTFIEHIDGYPDQTIITLKVGSGWRAGTQNKRAGQIASTIRIDVVSYKLTLDQVERAHRFTYLKNGPVYVITNYDLPSEAPMQWTFWGEELVLGSAE